MVYRIFVWVYQMSTKNGLQSIGGQGVENWQILGVYQMSTKATFEAIFGGFEGKNGGFEGVLNLAMGVIFVSEGV